MLAALVSQGLLCIAVPVDSTVPTPLVLAWDGVPVTATTNCGGVLVDPVAPAFGCGGGPDERKFVNLLSRSNQNGAPRDTANIVASNPKTFNTQFLKSAGNVDQPITGWSCAIFCCIVARFFALFWELAAPWAAETMADRRQYHLRDW